MGRALKSCSYVVDGQPCGELIEGKGSRCDAHRKQTQNATARTRTPQQGYGKQWRRFSRQYRAIHPTCVLCGNPSEHVDHIDGHGPTGPRGYDPTNLQALCKSCHSRKTVQHDGGLGHAPH